MPWAPDAFREPLPAGAVAAIPGGVPPFLVLALVRSDETPFVAAELDRLAALVRVASGTLQLHQAARFPDAASRAGGRRLRRTGSAPGPTGEPQEPCYGETAQMSEYQDAHKGASSARS